MKNMYEIEVEPVHGEVEIRQTLNGDQVTIYLTIEQATLVGRWIIEAGEVAEP